MPVLRNEIEKLGNNPYNAEAADLSRKMMLKTHVSRKDIPYLYHLFSLEVPADLKYICFNLLRFIDYEWHNIKALAEVFHCSFDTAEALISSPSSTASFPVIKAHFHDTQRACLANVSTIELEKENVFIYPHLIDDLSRISAITGKNYFAVFDCSICDRSFMLAIAAALILENKELLEQFSFTGSISEQKMVEFADHLEDKKQCCSLDGKKLVYGSFPLRALKSWLEEEIVPFPLAVLIGNAARDKLHNISKDIEKAVKKRFPHFCREYLKSFYNYDDQDLLFLRTENLPPLQSEWLFLINKQIRPAVAEILANSPPDRRELQIFGSLANLLFAVGVLIKDYIPFTAWHYQQGSYFPVISTASRPRDLKKRKDLSQFQKIDYKVINPQSDMIVIIYLASHSMFTAPQKYFEAKGRKPGIIYLKSKDSQGDLSVRDDWTLFVNEIYNLLNELKDKHQIEKFHFFFGCPVAIAFALGAAIGDYWDIDAYQFDPQQNTYYKVYSVKDLRIGKIVNTL